MTSAEDFDCVLCHAAAASPEVLAARDLYLGYPGRFDYYRCDSCGLVQQHPIPSDTEPFYLKYPVHGQRGRMFHLIRGVMMPDVYFRPDHGLSTMLLDFGCGNGDYLHGLPPSVRGVGYEPSTDLVKRLRQISRLELFSDLNALQQQYGERFDVVTMHCVLEHLPSPSDALSTAAKLLRAGGLLYVVLPHYDSWDRRMFGRNWHSLDAPRHLSFPDVSHFHVVAQAHGMTLKKWKDICFPNNLAGSISTVVCGRFNWPLTAALLPAAWIVQKINPTGTRAFWLYKN